jgi:hypothetical protein
VYESIYSPDPIISIYTKLNVNPALMSEQLTPNDKLQLHTIFNQDYTKFNQWESDLLDNAKKENATKMGQLYLSLEMK